MSSQHGIRSRTDKALDGWRRASRDLQDATATREDAQQAVTAASRAAESAERTKERAQRAAAAVELVEEAADETAAAARAALDAAVADLETSRRLEEQMEAVERAAHDVHREAEQHAYDRHRRPGGPEPKG